MPVKKQVYIIGGANGAGKTTSAKYLLTKFLDIVEFVNADEIARGISPYNPRSVDLSASRIMIKRIADLVRQGKNFAFETTLSGKNYLKLLKKLQKENYQVNLIFLYLDSPKEAKQRVAYRVKTGGHFIADEDIERRYYRGIKNLDEYLELADYAIVIDAASVERKIILKKDKKRIRILVSPIWEKILSIANSKS